MTLNPELIKYARRAVSMQKRSFQPPIPGDPNAMMAGGDPAAMMPPEAGGDPMMAAMGGGAPPGMPMDPSMMSAGGAPPGMPMPPGDPSMGMSMPPTDPAAGGAVPGAGGMNSDTIRTVMTEVLNSMGITPAQGPNAAGGQKPAKPDLGVMSMDIFQIKRMLISLFNSMGIDIPTDLILGQNRDPVTGQPTAPNAAGSTSDPSQNVTQSGQDGGGGDQGGAIPPISPMQGASPAGQGSEKTSNFVLGEETKRSIRANHELQNKAAALKEVLRRRSKVGA